MPSRIQLFNQAIFFSRRQRFNLFLAGHGHLHVPIALVVHQAVALVSLHSSLFLRIQQQGDEIAGQIGDTEAHATTLEHVVLSWNHLSFSATTPGDRPIVWTLELDAKGDSLEGWGHAFRSSDNHSWGGQIKLTRNN